MRGRADGTKSTRADPAVALFLSPSVFILAAASAVSSALAAAAAAAALAVACALSRRLMRAERNCRAPEEPQHRSAPVSPAAGAQVRALRPTFFRKTSPLRRPTAEEEETCLVREAARRIPPAPPARMDERSRPSFETFGGARPKVHYETIDEECPPPPLPS